MTSISIVGGIYRERCLQPDWNAVLGSAGRAAQAMAPLAQGRKRLYGYVGPLASDEAALLAELCEFELVAIDAEASVTFDYVHALSNPVVSPPLATVQRHGAIRVEDEFVLRFGMIEGTAIVNGRTVVYDPQSAFAAEPFRRNGSTADRLAVVLNLTELRAIASTEDPLEGARWLFDHDGAEVVIVKMGALGARVLTAASDHTIPAYRSDSVWKLGSGDVFSSMFGALWGLHNQNPEIAADTASRATAWYCGNRSLPTPERAYLLENVNRPLEPRAGRIYLAAPFFDLGQRWMVEEARRALLQAGIEVFSPVHDIGPGSADVVAPADLQALDGCDAVLAILNGMDPGTIFEAGYARKQRLPIVCLAENVRDEDLKMFVGSGSVVTADFATAIYQAIWSLPR